MEEEEEEKKMCLVWLKLSMRHREDFKDSGESFQKKGFSTAPTM